MTTLHPRCHGIEEKAQAAQEDAIQQIPPATNRIREQNSHPAGTFGVAIATGQQGSCWSLAGTMKTSRARTTVPARKQKQQNQGGNDDDEEARQ
ncbi:MAG: hypothetical protein IT383_10510 [Deltaproteobacteria bacterium]|nr:hypothetical protein [Deltaproteobacteria bacterium]